MSVPGFLPASSIAWMAPIAISSLFDTTASIDLNALQSETSNTIKSAQLLSLPDGQVVRLKLERPLRAFYEGVHAFRSHSRLLGAVFSLTFTLQAIRVLSIWAAAKAVGIDLSPLVYYVMGPLFFLVLLVGAAL